MNKILFGFFLTIIAMPAMAMDVTGTVKDSKETLIGANISAGDKHTQTDPNGQFSLKDVPDGAEITVSYIGYKTQTLPASGTMDITMEEAATEMETVVVRACNLQKLNATKAEWNNDQNKCVIQECKSGYKLDQNSCIEEKTEENPSQPENKETPTDKKPETKPETEATPEEPKLSKEDQDKKIAELQENADKMKEKEQSTANKMIGAAGIGATGIGGMQLMAGMAEQSADEAAERDMKAYLETFRCNYGSGNQHKGGETEIELPGANVLIPLYTEYAQLAADLKISKEALGLKPGIESETLFDKATTGLYDDVGIGRTGGAYTSLARAIMDPESDDAKAWAQQKADAASKKKTGMALAAAGAVGSLAANLAVNSGKDKKEKSAEINRKYEPLKKLQTSVKQLPKNTTPCPSGSTGSSSPDCVCTGNAIYSENTNTCEQCNGNMVATDGKCTCPTDARVWDQQQSKCVAEPTSCTPKCIPVDGDHLKLNTSDCNCSCLDGYDYKNGVCTCDAPKVVGNDGKCGAAPAQQQTPAAKTEPETITLDSSQLFKIGSAELSDNAKAVLTEFLTGMKDANYKSCNLNITGYTDPVGSDSTNKTLSEKRANAIKDHIAANATTDLIKSSTATGMGETKCTCGLGKDIAATARKPANDYSACNGKADNYALTGNVRYAPCRRVEISVTCESAPASESAVSNLVDQVGGLLGGKQ